MNLIIFLNYSTLIKVSKYLELVQISLIPWSNMLWSVKTGLKVTIEWLRVTSHSDCDFTRGATDVRCIVSFLTVYFYGAVEYCISNVHLFGSMFPLGWSYTFRFLLFCGNWYLLSSFQAIWLGLEWAVRPRSGLIICYCCCHFYYNRPTDFASEFDFNTLIKDLWS